MLRCAAKVILLLDTPQYGTLRELVRVYPDLRFCQQVVIPQADLRPRTIWAKTQRSTASACMALSRGRRNSTQSICASRPVLNSPTLYRSARAACGWRHYFEMLRGSELGPRMCQCRAVI